MRNILFYLCLMFSVASFSQEVEEVIKGFKKHDIEINQNAIIIGVGKNDCRMHTVDLGKVCQFLENKKTTNVILITDQINDLGKFIYDKFGIRLNSNIPVIQDEKLYSLFYKIPLSFCAVVDMEKIIKDQIGLFFSKTNEINENYNLGISKVVDITYLDSFSPWEVVMDEKYIGMLDYPSQHAVILDIHTGNVKASLLSRAIELPDSVKLSLIGNRSSFELSQYMKKNNGYKIIGVDEVAIKGITFDENEETHLYLDYTYFMKKNKDTIFDVKSIVAVCNDRLQVKNFIWLNFKKGIKSNHSVALLFNSQVITKEKFMSYNRSTVGIKTKYGFTELLRKGNEIIEEDKKLYPLSKSISRKDYKGHMDLTCYFDMWNEMSYAYHNNYPLIYLFQKDEVKEVLLENEHFTKSNKLFRTESYFTMGLKKAKTGCYLLNSMNRITKNYTISYHSQTGKKIGEYKLSGVPTIDIQEGKKGRDYFWTYMSDKETKKRYAIKVEAYY